MLVSFLTSDLIRGCREMLLVPGIWFSLGRKLDIKGARWIEYQLDHPAFGLFWFYLDKDAVSRFHNDLSFLSLMHSSTRMFLISSWWLQIDQWSNFGRCRLPKFGELRCWPRRPRVPQGSRRLCQGSARCWVLRERRKRGRKERVFCLDGGADFLMFLITRFAIMAH